MSENNGKKMRRYGKNFWTRFIDLFRPAKNRKAPENVLEEEAITTPAKTIVKNYFHNPIGVIGLVGFVAIFLTVMIGAAILKYDPYYSQGILKNIGPGFGYMEYPKHLTDSEIVDIRSGITFSAGINADGKLYFWGKDYDGATVVPDKFKEKLEEEKVVHLAVGDRHTLVHTDKGNFYGWGNNYFGQDTVPGDVSMVTRSEGVKKMDAGVQFSVILTEKGNLLVWGSTMANNLDRVPKDLKNNVEDFDVSSLNIITARKDGGVQIFGAKGSPIYNIPKELEPGGKKLKQVAIGTYSCLALDEDGKLWAWGASQEGTTKLPEFDAPVAEIGAGVDYFTARTETGKLYTWGKNYFDVTETTPEGSYAKLFSGYYQNYAVTEDGSIDTWGNNGYIMGTDDVGRDLFARLLSGGRVTLLIAFVSVIIQVFIGVVVGMISGFYGGTIDNLLQRFTEIVASFPFYPLIITLTVILPPDTSQNKRLLLIMVILGVLGWTGIARLVRGQILSEREKDYILAARALGLRENKIIANHILPNVLSIVIVQATLGYAGNLLTEAGLSFLGFGVKAPYPSWGNMLTNAQKTEVLQIYWWRWIYPALAVFLAAFTINLIGDALRDAMDPKAAER